MSKNDATDKTTADERYAAIETGGGETMIYDRSNPDAWLQSNYAIDVGT